MIHHRNESTTKLRRLSPWPITPAVHQVNLPFSYHYHHYRSKGTSLPHQPETRIRHTGDEFARQTEWKKHKLCLSISYTYTSPRRNRKERQAYSLLQTTMEPLPHGLWSCSSKPLTGRTGQAEGRFSYWKHQETQPVPQESSTGQGLVS